MAGKGNAVIRIGSVEAKSYSEHTGGDTQPATRDVPDTSLPGTMRTEPSGGEIRNPLVITFIEREDEGEYLDTLYMALTGMRDSPDPKARRQDIVVEYYKDKEMKSILGTLSVRGAWPTEVSMMETDKASTDPRTFSATFAHLGSKYTTATAKS